MRRRLDPRSSIAFLVCLIIFSWIPESVSAATVTLNSFEINKTHGVFISKPSVYFKCNGENKTILPDVKEKHVLYTFKGEESWQPLTELEDKKCKRCGFYEEDPLLPDNIFEEWEFCASDFSKSDGIYIRFKENDFNATFLCPDCVPHESEAPHESDSIGSSDSQSGGTVMHWAIIVLISVFVSIIFILGLLMGYKYYQKRKRQKDQARFLKLFEDGDDIEDELGIGPLGGVI